MSNVYVVRIYVVAKSAADAIRKSKKIPPHDVWLEDNSQKKLVEEAHEKITKTKKVTGFKRKK